MSDIVERLKVTEADGRELPLHELRYEAAAEIERLHEREMNAKCCHCGGVIFAVEDEWAKAKAEIERLNSELLAERLANIGKVPPCNDSTAANLASALADNERLREENKTFRAAQKACEHCDAPTVAEIERLRHELADAHGVAQACEIRAEKAEAEVERLRGLLRDVDDGLDDYWVTTKDGVSWICRRSEALGE